jgi:hypothetical protein
MESTRERLFFNFDDADQERPPIMVWSLDWKTVKKPSRPGFVNGMKIAAKPVTGKRLLLSPPSLCFL